MILVKRCSFCCTHRFPRLQVYPLHSSVTLEEQNNVFLSPVPGYRKVGVGPLGRMVAVQPRCPACCGWC